MTSAKLEIGKIEKVDLDNIRIPAQRSEFTNRIENLEVGQGFAMSGIERSNIQSRVFAAKRRTGRSFAVKKTGELEYLIYRYA